MTEDAALLRRFVSEKSQPAFAELVARHLDFVYSAALRQVNGDAHLAADVAQTVFVDLARKARTVSGHAVLKGWLFTSTRFAAAKVVRGEQRRRRREMEAHLMELTNGDSSTAVEWERVRPLIDEALDNLSPGDRDAVLLRFFEKRDYADIGERLNLRGNTARMRVERALDRIRARLERRGVTSTSAALAAALAGQAAAAAPAGLAANIAATAVVSGTATGAAAWLTFMATTKLHVAAASIVVLGGTATFFVQEHEFAKLAEEHAAQIRTVAETARLRAEAAGYGELSREAERLRFATQDLPSLRREKVDLQRRMAAGGRARPAPPAAVPTPLSGPVLDMAQLDRSPRPRFYPAPTYPRELLRSNVPGEAIVEFTVDAEGRVHNPVAKRATQAVFGEAAVEAVQHWTFDPGRKGGLPVNTRMQVPIVFTIGGDKDDPQVPDAVANPAWF